MKPKTKKIAAALSYHQGDIAPKVTASGEGYVADRITAAAQIYDIPVVYEPALAASLVALPVNSSIPETLYRAAAEVIAFCYLTYKEAKL